MEKILLANTGATAGNSSSTARTLAGFPAWIRSTAQPSPSNGNGVGVGTVTGPVFSGGASSYAGVPTSGWTLTSGAANFTQTNLQTAIAALYSNGGEPKMMMVGPVNKARVSGFAGLSATRINTNLHANTTSGNAGNQGTIVGAADLYLNVGVAA